MKNLILKTLSPFASLPRRVLWFLLLPKNRWLFVLWALIFMFCLVFSNSGQVEEAWNGRLIIPAMAEEYNLDENGNSIMEFNVPVPTSYDWSIKVDLDLVAYCVAVSETNDCTKGMGVTKNNCFGIMQWTPLRNGKTYPNKKASYDDFKRLWASKYGGRYPTYLDADKYTGQHDTDTWYSNFNSCYKSHLLD